MNARIVNQRTTSKYIDVLGSRMHYIDEGSGDPVVFIHGNPTSSYIWRNIIPYLSDGYRCIAPDLIGMGDSDKPNIEYSFQDQYKHFCAFIEALHLENITFVLHDWGSALGGLYAKEHPEQIAALCFLEAIIRPWKWSYLKWNYRIGFWLLRQPIIGEILVYSANTFPSIFLPRLIKRKMSSIEIEHYKKPFQRKSSRKPLLQFPREIPINKTPNHMYSLVRAYSKYLQHSHVPKLLIYANPGAIIREKEVEWCQNYINNLEIRYIGEGLHFIQEDHPEKIGQALKDWMLQLA